MWPTLLNLLNTRTHKNNYPYIKPLVTIKPSVGNPLGTILFSNSKPQELNPLSRQLAAKSPKRLRLALQGYAKGPF